MTTASISSLAASWSKRMDRLRAWPTAAIGKYCWWHETQSCLLTCLRNASRELAAVVCNAANAFSAAAITVESSSSSGSERCGVTTFSGRGGSLAPAAASASTIAERPRLSAINRGVCGTISNASTGSPPAAFGSAPLARSSLTRSGRSVSLPAAQCKGVKSANASRASTFAPRSIRILAASTPSFQHACDNGLP